MLNKDVISPVKKAATGPRFLKEFEREETQRRIYAPKLIPPSRQPEMRVFTENEFVSKVTLTGDCRADDQFNPVDGELEKAADDLAAFVEAYLALKNGIANPQLEAAVREKRLFYRQKGVAGIDFHRVYKDFT